MASWNSSIMLNNLIQEINNIGYYTGYLYNLIPVNGAIVSNNNTACSFVDTSQQVYSSVSRNSNWSMSMTVGLNTNIVLGYSTDLSKVYVGANTIGMQNMDYGILADNQTLGGGMATFYVKGGIYDNNTLTSYPNAINTIKINYDGSNLKYYVNNVIVNTISVGIIDDAYLVIGSFNGGSANSITWTGSGSSSGALQNLQQVLTVGNDAGNLGIINLSTLNVNNNIECQELEASNQITATNSINAPLLYGNSNKLSFASDSTKNKNMDIQTITGSSPYSGNPVISLYNQANTKIGQVFDSFFNPSSNSYNFTFTNTLGTKLINPNQFTSIITFPINKGFTSYSLNFSQFAFSYDSNGSAIPLGQGQFKFWITDVKDDIPYTLYGNSFITPDISQTGNYVSPDNIILEYTNVNQSTLLYLNVYIEYENGGTYDLNDWGITGQLIGNISPINTIQPYYTA